MPNTKPCFSVYLEDIVLAGEGEGLPPNHEVNVRQTSKKKKKIMYNGFLLEDGEGLSIRFRFFTDPGIPIFDRLNNQAGSKWADIISM